MTDVDSPPGVVPVKQRQTQARTRRQEDFSGEQQLCCVICRHAITSSRDATVRQGNHFHDRTNPDGRRFLIACFQNAPGCFVSGNSTAIHSWFTGYHWSFAHCAGCSCQIGWHYSGEQPFFGLMVEQLVECAGDQAG